MTILTPQYRVIGDDWTFAVAFADRAGRPINFVDDQLTPGGEFFQTNINMTVPMSTLNGRIWVDDPASGVAYYTIPSSMTIGVMSNGLYAGPVGKLLPAPGVAADTFPLRLHAWCVDAAGKRQTYTTYPVIPVDPRTTDLSTIPDQSTLVMYVGPAGPRGLPGDPATVMAVLQGLPTTLPALPGQPWWNGNVLSLS